MSTCDKLLVAAIEIGTTHSSLAFSTKRHYNVDPLKIMSVNWLSDFRGVTQIKNSTCILFNKDKVFDSFGYEAENKYTVLAEEEKHQEWYFFKNFKTTLFNKVRT